MASSNTGHIESKILPHCWVCGVRFTDLTVNPGPAAREDHHIIPQAYGGTDGPLVSLCDSHHTAVHKIAVALKNQKPYQHLLGTYDQGQINKLLWLATRIQEAELATRNDPNKRMQVVVTLDGLMRAKLDALVNIYPSAKGRAELIRTAIEFLYTHHFKA
jgi:hypothetical protein